MSARDRILRRVDTESGRFEESWHPQAFGMAEHVHAHSHVTLVLEGCIETSFGRTRHVATEGRVQFVPGGAVHASRYCGRVRVLHLGFAPAWWERVGGSCTPASGALFTNDGVTAAARRMVAELRDPDGATPLMLQALAAEAVVAMARRKADPLETEAPRWLRRVEARLRAHPESGVGLDALAEFAGVHPAHLARTFRRTYGRTIGEFLRERRIEAALVRLADPRCRSSLGEIALDLGFADQSTFGKAFRRATGTTPAAYRRDPRIATPGPTMLG